jgi:multisubunit Na+/H+ antiporter MnhB subunit
MMIILDLLLAITVILVAIRCLYTPNLAESVVLFIVFGLLIALIWVRLQAPDAALAEVAIGAGLAGALLLATLSQLQHTQDAQPKPIVLWSLSIPLLLGGALALSLMSLVQPAPGLSDMVITHLSASGVEHSVTAVLLNYRAWDTALELAVLMWAWAAQRALGPSLAWHGVRLQGQVVVYFTRLLVPLLALVGGYVLWQGAYAPGGAFQAGALLAAALILAFLVQQTELGQSSPAFVTGFIHKGWIKVLWLGGLMAFFGVGLAGLLAGFGFMGYPPAYAGQLILFIEVAATLSIALILAALFTGEGRRYE